MNLKSNVLLSYKSQVKTALETSGSGFDTGFNVYNEDDLKNNVAPENPYVYVVSTHILPREVTLPFIGVQMLNRKARPVEMGNKKGSSWQALLHIYSKTRAQRNDIASYLSDPDIIDVVPIYNYTSGSPVLSEYAQVDHEQTWQEETDPDAEDSLEGSWRYREIVSHTLLTNS